MLSQKQISPEGVHRRRPLSCGDDELLGTRHTWLEVTPPPEAADERGEDPGIGNRRGARDP